MTANINFNVPNIVELDTNNFDHGLLSSTIHQHDNDISQQQLISRLSIAARSKLKRFDTSFNASLRTRAHAYARWALLNEAVKMGIFKQEAFINLFYNVTEANSGNIQSVDEHIARRKLKAKEQKIHHHFLTLLQKDGPIRDKIEKYMQCKAYSEYIQQQRQKRARMGDNLSQMEYKIVEICLNKKNINSRTTLECQTILQNLVNILAENCTLSYWLENSTKQEKILFANNLQYAVVRDTEVILWQGSKPKSTSDDFDSRPSTPNANTNKHSIKQKTSHSTVDPIEQKVNESLSKYDAVNINDCCHILLSGQCDVYVNESLNNRRMATYGNEGIKIGTIESGTLFGDTSFYLNERRNATVIANGNCELLCLNKNGFNTIMRRYITQLINKMKDDLEHFEPFEMQFFQKTQLNNVILHFYYNKLYNGQLLQIKGEKQNKIHFLLNGACNEYIPKSGVINNKNGAIISKKLKKRESTDTLTFFGIKTNDENINLRNNNNNNRNNSNNSNNSNNNNGTESLFMRPQTAKSAFDDYQMSFIFNKKHQKNDGKKETNFKSKNTKNCKLVNSVSMPELLLSAIDSTLSNSYEMSNDNNNNTRFYNNSNNNKLSDLYHASNILSEHETASNKLNSPIMKQIVSSRQPASLKHSLKQHGKHDILTIGENSIIGAYYAYYNIIPQTNIQCISTNGLALTIEIEYLKTFLDARTKLLFEKTIQRDYKIVQNRLHSVKSLISMPFTDISININSNFNYRNNSNNNTSRTDLASIQTNSMNIAAASNFHTMDINRNNPFYHSKNRKKSMSQSVPMSPKNRRTIDNVYNTVSEDRSQEANLLCMDLNENNDMNRNGITNDDNNNNNNNEGTTLQSRQRPQTAMTGSQLHSNTNINSNANTIEDEKIELLNINISEPKIEITKRNSNNKNNKKLKKQKKSQSARNGNSLKKLQLSQSQVCLCDHPKYQYQNQQYITIPRQSKRPMSAKNLGIRPIAKHEIGNRFNTTLCKHDQLSEMNSTSMTVHSMLSTSRSTFEIPCFRHERLSMIQSSHNDNSDNGNDNDNDDGYYHNKKRKKRKKMKHDKDIDSSMKLKLSSKQLEMFEPFEQSHNLMTGERDKNMLDSTCQLSKNVYKVLNERMKIDAANVHQNVDMARRKYYKRLTKDPFTQRRVSHARPNLEKTLMRRL